MMNSVIQIVYGAEMSLVLMFAALLLERFLHFVTERAVSYTHLDVYKRQP